MRDNEVKCVVACLDGLGDIRLRAVAVFLVDVLEGDIEAFRNGHIAHKDRIVDNIAILFGKGTDMTVVENAEDARAVILFGQSVGDLQTCGEDIFINHRFGFSGGLRVDCGHIFRGGIAAFLTAASRDSRGDKQRCHQ